MKNRPKALLAIIVLGLAVIGASCNNTTDPNEMNAADTMTTMPPGPPAHIDTGTPAMPPAVVDTSKHMRDTLPAH